jgi:signal transduction histidine kinase/tetratricopeptide (TPR) repeat protein
MTDSQTIRQLERQLADSEDSADVFQKIDILNDLAWALSDTDLKRAYSLGETAYTMATSPADGAPPYEAGEAYALRTQGYVNQRLGNYPLGLTQLFKAQGMCESLKLDDGLSDVFDGIAGIYYQIGDFPAALNHMYRQLDVAQRIGDRRRVANAYNNLANIYFESGDYDRAIETLHHNLQIAGEINYGRIVALSFLNLAETYLLMGDGEKALENGLRALGVSQETGFELFEVYAFDLIGKSYRKLGDPLQAIHYLEQALALSMRLESKVTEPLILLSLGEAYRDMQQLDRALEYLQQGITIAQSIDARSELFKAHLLLSDIYQVQGDLTQALHHFKQYHAIRELVFSDEADRRLKVLQVAYDTETARREAEIAHLRTVELQQEVAEHAQVRLQLQRQLDYAQALARCSQTLLAVAEGEASQQQVLNRALEHLRVGSQASRAYVFRSFQDYDLGPCIGIFAEACAPDVHPHLANPANRKAPSSWLPTAVFDALRAGKPAGGPVETLFASTPLMLEAFRRQIKPLLSVQLFPIFINDQWWGFVGFDDCEIARQWGEGEIMMLGTASEMMASTLQRWQAETDLSSLNVHLEHQVETRTTELLDAVDRLRNEVKERERAESALQETMASLEQRVAARTDELAAFFDLMVLASQAVDVADVFEQAVPRIMEVTRSQAICIHLLDEDRTALWLAAQQGLAEEVQERVQTVELPPEFRRWLQQPNDPLLTTALPDMMLFSPALRLPGFDTCLAAQIMIGQRTEGLLSYFRFDNSGYGLDEVALGTALAEQMGTMLETHRLRQSAEAVAVLEERQRLARDLHDSVTQSLYSLSLFSRAAREAAEDGDANRLSHSLTELEHNTLHILREMRLLLYELRPADLEQEGLIRAIELRLDAVERRANLQLDVHLGELAGLSPSQEVELYHIVVEALNNVVKHAAATRVALQLTQANGVLHLCVVDDGRGFDPAQTKGGMGLRNIRERVARLDGRLSVSSAPGGGTRLEAVVPCRMEVDV